jgi:hypothetical protein
MIGFDDEGLAGRGCDVIPEVKGWLGFGQFSS